MYIYMFRELEYTKESLIKFRDEKEQREKAEKEAAAGVGEGFGGFGGFGGGGGGGGDKKEEEKEVITCIYMHISITYLFTNSHYRLYNTCTCISLA